MVEIGFYQLLPVLPGKNRFLPKIMEPWREYIRDGLSCSLFIVHHDPVVGHYIVHQGHGTSEYCFRVDVDIVVRHRSSLQVDITHKD